MLPWQKQATKNIHRSTNSTSPTWRSHTRRHHDSRTQPPSTLRPLHQRDNIHTRKSQWKTKSIQCHKSSTDCINMPTSKTWSSTSGPTWGPTKLRTLFDYQLHERLTHSDVSKCLEFPRDQMKYKTNTCRDLADFPGNWTNRQAEALAEEVGDTTMDHSTTTEHSHPIQQPESRQAAADPVEDAPPNFPVSPRIQHIADSVSQTETGIHGDLTADDSGQTPDAAAPHRNGAQPPNPTRHHGLRRHAKVHHETKAPGSNSSQHDESHSHRCHWHTFPYGSDTHHRPHMTEDTTTNYTDTAGPRFGPGPPPPINTCSRS